MIGFIIFIGVVLFAAFILKVLAAIDRPDVQRVQDNTGLFLREARERLFPRIADEE